MVHQPMTQVQAEQRDVQDVGLGILQGYRVLTHYPEAILNLLLLFFCDNVHGRCVNNKVALNSAAGSFSIEHFLIVLE